MCCTQRLAIPVAPPGTARTPPTGSGKRGPNHRRQRRFGPIRTRCRQAQADNVERLPTVTLARPGSGSGPAGTATGVEDAAPDIFGRDTELNVLHAVAGEAIGRPDCRVVLIAGEAGAGKSTLVDRFSRELAANRWRVVIGRCPESAGAPPAWAWVEALRTLSAEIDPGQLSPALAPLLDETTSTTRESDASFGRFLLGRAVIGYLTAAARSQPLAIVLGRPAPRGFGDPRPAGQRCRRRSPGCRCC